MKKLSTYLGIIIGSLVLGANPAVAQQAQQDWAKSTAALSYASGTTTGVQTAVPTEHASSVLFHVVGAGENSSVTFEQSIDGSHYYTSATITNAAAAGELWACPAAAFARFNVVSHSAGALYGYMTTREWNSDPLGASCKKIDTSVAVTAITSGVFSGPITGTSGTFSTTLGVTGTATFGSTVAATAGVSGTTGAFSAGVSGTTGTFSALTATRIPFNGVGGVLSDVANFTYTTATGALVNTNGSAPSIATNRFLSTGTAPAVANVGADSCGTDAATIVGKDQVSIVTVGATSGTECRVTFNVAFANAPGCTATGQTATDLHGVSTTTYYDFVGTLTAGEKITVMCFGF